MCANSIVHKISICNCVVEGEDLEDNLAPVKGDLFAFGICPDSASFAILFGPSDICGSAILEEDAFTCAYNLVEHVFVLI